VEELYATDTVPTLKEFSKISYGGDIIYIPRSAHGGVGWMYRKVFASPKGKEAKVQMIVLKEQGRIGVSSVGPWE
jgi:hypothetical protein